MIKNRNIKNLAALLVVMLFSVAVSAQNTFRVKSHEIVIEGTSNLHDWTADVENAEGTFNLLLEENKIVTIQEGTLKLQASSIKGSEGRRMDSKIHDALEVEKHPDITFSLRDIKNLSSDSGTLRINAEGVLTVSGVSKLVTLNTTGKILPNGDVELSGTHNMNMSDHGVSAPTALLGALKTGDSVAVNYKVVLSSISYSEN